MKRALVSLSFIVIVIVRNLSYADSHTLISENDVYTGSDDSYTNGMIYTRTKDMSNEEGNSPCAKTTLLNRAWCLPGLNQSSVQNYVSYSVIHEIFTPEDLTTNDPSLADQPYSSVLLGAVTLSSQGEKWSHYWSLRAGMVGPATGGKVIQQEFHRLTGATIPRGWDTQLPNEVLVNLGYMGGRSFAGDFRNRWQWRVTPAYNVEVGNYVTAVGYGVLGEVGMNLADGPVIGTLGQGLGATSGLHSWTGSQWSLGFYFGLANYHIAHYVPLDGPLFSNSRSVGYENSVLFTSAGLRLRRGNLSFGYGITRGAPGARFLDDDLDYGTLTVSWNL